MSIHDCPDHDKTAAAVFNNSSRPPGGMDMDSPNNTLLRHLIFSNFNGLRSPKISAPPVYHTRADRTLCSSAVKSFR